MLNYAFPTISVDNFFDEPLKIKEFALNQKYHKDLSGRYPGQRTDCVSEINCELYFFIVKRFLSIFYNENEELNFRCSMFFQKINKKYEKGWVHKDEALVTGIIYLNENIDLNCGTSIYHSKNNCAPFESRELLEKKEKFYKDEMQDDEIRKFDELTQKNNSNFDEVISLKNKFNRLIAFDSHQYHAAQNFNTETEEERLTIVFFMHQLHLKNNFYPLQKSKRVSI